MRLAARFIATMAVAFVMVPALYANDAAKPNVKPKKTKAAPSIVARTVIAKVQTSPPETLPARFSTSRLLYPLAYAEPADAEHKRGESENHTPKVEWFLGYSFWRATPTESSNRMAYLNGGSTSIAFNFKRSVGLVADFGGYDNTKLTLLNSTGTTTVDADGSAYTYLFGPRFSVRRHEKFTPFFQALFGGAHASSVTISGCTGGSTCTPLGSENAFAMMFGVGFDIKISHHIALRPIEGDFLLTHFNIPSSAGGQGKGWQKNVRLSSGIVFRFGGKHAPPPPPPSAPISATCAADPDSVYAGSGDFITVRAQVSNPDNNPLNYNWTTNSGAVEGSGSEVRWNSAGANPGTYTLRVRVDAGPSGTAECSADIRVKPRPNRPPTMSCSADRNSVLIGETVDVTAIASDPDNDPLTLSWNASGGNVSGSERSAKFDTSGLKAGQYSVTGHVDDGRGGTADCQLSIEVREPPPPPEMVELESRLALHSIYFQTARPSVANPNGGLVESQEKILATLAVDFKGYLRFKPNAHLILGGHADQRGSMEYNKSLTERRVERTKNFLVEQGVPASDIETRTFGDENNLSPDQVKEQIAQNPDLNQAERQQMLNNLNVMVLANNRRVDVTLSTTGQQSTHRYPFNARDFLALINTQAGGKKPPARPSHRKKNTKP